MGKTLNLIYWWWTMNVPAPVRSVVEGAILEAKYVVLTCFCYCRFWEGCPLFRFNNPYCVGGGGPYCGKWRKQNEASGV